MTKTKTKVAIISQSLEGGGAERFAVTLSHILNSLNYEIHNVVINDKIDYIPRGVIYNLEIESSHLNWLYRKIKKGILLNKYLKENNIEVIIDNRTRIGILKEFITKLIYSNRRVFYLIHSYKTENYLPNSLFFAKIIYSNAEKLICVSKAIQNIILDKYKFKNTFVIYNPFDLFPNIEDKKIDFLEKYILFFGRFDEKVKNFNLMLGAFNKSEIYKKGYKLIIMGQGKDEELIKLKIQELYLQNNVKIIPFQKNPFLYVKNARYTVLTSKYEGFPMSIIESLGVGTPVISVDCKSGPSEVIINEYNGLLIENNNEKLLSVAFKRFIDDDLLYNFCKGNAQKSIEYLSMTNIGYQWQKILS